MDEVKELVAKMEGMKDLYKIAKILPNILEKISKIGPAGAQKTMEKSRGRP